MLMERLRCAGRLRSCLLLVCVAACYGNSIWLTGIAAFSGAPDESTGYAQRLGAEIMLGEVNSNPAILPGYELKVVWQDGCCTNAGISIGYRLFLENLLQDTWTPYNSTPSTQCWTTSGDVETWNSTAVNGGSVGLLGPGCSSATSGESRSAEAADRMSFPMISFTRGPSKLNGALYRNFFRTVLPDVNVSMAFLALTGHLNESIQVLSIRGSDAEWKLAEDFLAATSDEMNITFNKRALVSTDSAAIESLVLEDFIVKQQRVVFLLLDVEAIKLVLCELQSQDFYGSIFMTFGRYKDGWWTEPPADSSCTAEQLTQAAEGIVMADMLYWRPEVNQQLGCSTSMTAKGFRDRYNSERAAAGYAPADEAATLGDAVCMFALMLHQMLIVQGFTLSDLQARNATVYQEEVAALRASDFEGVQGRVVYGASTAGTPIPESTVLLQQLQNGVKVNFGTYKASTNQLAFDGATMQLPYQHDTFSEQFGSSRLAPFDTCNASEVLNFTLNECLQCPTGRQKFEGSCICRAGFKQVGLDCVACSPGTISIRIQASNCTQCQPGRFSASPGQSKCELCQPNNFSDMTGATACTRCSFDGLQVTDGTASTNRSECRCNNAYKVDPNDVDCIKCPDKSTTLDNRNPVGPGSCKCNQGYYMKDQTCIACPANSATDGPGKLSVHDCHCEAGRFLNSAERDEDKRCDECPEGMRCLMGSDAKNRACLLEEEEREGEERQCKKSLDLNLCTLDNAESCYSNVSRRFPLLLPGYWAPFPDRDGSDYTWRQVWGVSNPYMPPVFNCADNTRCKGGNLPGDVCDLTTKRNYPSCQRCADEYYWDADRTLCRKCSGMQASKFLYPVLPILLAPVIILLFYRFFGDALPMWGSWQNSIAALAFIVLNHYQVLGIVGASNVGLPETLNGPFGTFKATTELSWGLNTECLGLHKLFDDMLSKALYPVILGLAALVAEIISLLAARADPMLRLDRNRLLNVFLSIMFTFFGAISAMSLQLFKCSPNPRQTPSTTLSTDRSVICYSSDWRDGLGLAIACVCVYVIFMGTFFLYAICRAPSHFGDPGFQMRWKFLFIKFHAGAYWWGIVFLLKNFLVNLVPVCVRSQAPQLYVSITVILFYLAGTVLWLPYRTEIANWFEVFACIGIVYVTSLLTWHAERTQYVTDRVTQATVAISVLPAVALPGLVIYVFSRGHRLVQIQASHIEGVKQTFESLAKVEVETGVRMLLALTEAERRSIFNSSFVLRADHLGHRSWRRINQAHGVDDGTFSTVYTRLRAQSLLDSKQKGKKQTTMSGGLSTELTIYTSGRGSQREVPFAAPMIHV